MTRRTHEKLVNILAPYLQRVEYNCHSSGPILVEHIVAVGLRVLSGGKTKDQCHITEMCLDAAYKAQSCRHFFDPVNAAPELDDCMWKTEEEWHMINHGFKRKSTNEIIAGCNGALDGFFQHTNNQGKVKSSTCLPIIPVTMNPME